MSDSSSAVATIVNRALWAIQVQYVSDRELIGTVDFVFNGFLLMNQNGMCRNFSKEWGRYLSIDLGDKVGMVKTFFLDYITRQLRNDYVLLISRNLFQLYIAYLCPVGSRLIVKIAVLGPLDNNWVTDLAWDSGYSLLKMKVADYAPSIRYLKCHMHLKNLFNLLCIESAQNQYFDVHKIQNVKCSTLSSAPREKCRRLR